MIVAYCHPASVERAQEFCAEITKGEEYVLVQTVSVPMERCYLFDQTLVMSKDLTKADANRQDSEELPPGPDNPPPQVPASYLPKK